MMDPIKDQPMGLKSPGVISTQTECARQREMTPGEIGEQARLQAQLRKCQQWRAELDSIRERVLEMSQFDPDDEPRGVATRIREAAMWLKEMEIKIRQTIP